MMRPRLLLFAAATAVTVTGSMANAAPTIVPQLTDPVGDARALGASYDIVSGLLTTTGTTTTAKVGRKMVKTYTPKNLVAVLTLAGPPSTQTGSVYTFAMATTACGNGSFQFQFTPGATLQSGDLFVTGCGKSTPATGPAEFISDVKAQLSGNTITWTMPLADMGSDLPLSTVFSAFTAETDINDPVLGLVGTGAEGPTTSIDSAKSDASWKLG